MSEENTLIAVDEYLNAGVHVGTKFKNAHLKEYIFRCRSDGLKVIDTGLIDKKLRALIKLISNYEPSEIAVFGRRENAKKPIKTFGRVVGCDVFAGRYLPGSLTNVELNNFKEYKLILIADPLTDKNVLNEAFETGIVTAALCDTNNIGSKIDLVVPFNNKGKRSLGLAFYLIAKNYMANKGQIALKDFDYTIDDFSEE